MTRFCIPRQTQPKLYYLSGKRQELIEMLLINFVRSLSTRKLSNGLPRIVFSTRGYDQKQQQVAAAAGICYWPHPRQQHLRALSLVLRVLFVLSHTQRSKRPSPLSLCQPPRQRQHLRIEMLQITFLTSNAWTMAAKLGKIIARYRKPSTYVTIAKPWSLFKLTDGRVKRVNLRSNKSFGFSIINV